MRFFLSYENLIKIYTIYIASSQSIETARHYIVHLSWQVIKQRGFMKWQYEMVPFTAPKKDGKLGMLLNKSVKFL